MPRLIGFRDQLDRYGVQLAAELIRYPALVSGENDGPLDTLFELPAPPEAVFAATDDLAIRVLQAARQRAAYGYPAIWLCLGSMILIWQNTFGLTTISQSLDDSAAWPPKSFWTACITLRRRSERRNPTSGHRAADDLTTRCAQRSARTPCDRTPARTDSSRGRKRLRWFSQTSWPARFGGCSRWIHRALRAVFCQLAVFFADCLLSVNRRLVRPF